MANRWNLPFRAFLRMTSGEITWYRKPRTKAIDRSQLWVSQFSVSLMDTSVPDRWRPWTWLFILSTAVSCFTSSNPQSPTRKLTFSRFWCFPFIRFTWRQFAASWADRTWWHVWCFCLAESFILMSFIKVSKTIFMKFLIKFECFQTQTHSNWIKF